MRVRTSAKAFSPNPPGDKVRSKGAGFPYAARLGLFPAAFPAPTAILPPSSTLPKPQCLEVAASGGFSAFL